MRLAAAAALSLLLAAAAGGARADAPYEARTAVEACLAAVIDNAPVEDATGVDVAIHREANPNLCTVKVTGGAPAEVRDAVLAAVGRRPEGFAPARTAWAPGALASRETLCSRPGRRALNVVIETGRPGASPALTAAVAESRQRDARCDRDLGVQAP
jgi:hypothetical protein